MTGVFDLSRREIEGEDGDGIRILIRDDEKLPAVVELEVTRRLTPRVEEANLSERATNGLALVTGGALLRAKDRDRLVSAIGHYDEPSGLMDANSTACVHRDWER